MKILFLGDVVAKSGRQAITEKLHALIDQYQIDFTIVNGENAAHGKGITKKIYEELIEAGADVVTLGNHAFAKKDIIPHMDECKYLVRPANMDPSYIGQPYVVKECRGKKVAVMNVLGSAFMSVATGDPIAVMSRIIPRVQADIYIVDFHAETTSEKGILFEYFKDVLTAVIGTHTHVQTADERVVDGCAYISDVGMCGPYDSILGRNTNEIMEHTLHGAQTHYKPAKGPAIISGCIIDIDDDTNRAKSIERLQIRPISHV